MQRYYTKQLPKVDTISSMTPTDVTVFSEGNQDPFSYDRRYQPALTRQIEHQDNATTQAFDRLLPAKKVGAKKSPLGPQDCGMSLDDCRPLPLPQEYNLSPSYECPLPPLSSRQWPLPQTPIQDRTFDVCNGLPSQQKRGQHFGRQNYYQDQHFDSIYGDLDQVTATITRPPDDPYYLATKVSGHRPLEGMGTDTSARITYSNRPRPRRGIGHYPAANGYPRRHFTEPPHLTSTGYVASNTHGDGVRQVTEPLPLSSKFAPQNTDGTRSIQSGDDHASGSARYRYQPRGNFNDLSYGITPQRDHVARGMDQCVSRDGAFVNHSDRSHRPVNHQYGPNIRREICSKPQQMKENKVVGIPYQNHSGKGVDNSNYGITPTAVRRVPINVASSSRGKRSGVSCEHPNLSHVNIRYESPLTDCHSFGNGNHTDRSGENMVSVNYDKAYGTPEMNSFSSGNKMQDKRAGMRTEGTKYDGSPHGVPKLDSFNSGASTQEKRDNIRMNDASYDSSPHGTPAMDGFVSGITSQDKRAGIRMNHSGYGGSITVNQVGPMNEDSSGNTTVLNQSSHRIDNKNEVGSDYGDGANDDRSVHSQDIGHTGNFNRGMSIYTQSIYADLEGQPSSSTTRFDELSDDLEYDKVSYAASPERPSAPRVNTLADGREDHLDLYAASPERPSADRVNTLADGREDHLDLYAASLERPSRSRTNMVADGQNRYVDDHYMKFSRSRTSLNEGANGCDDDMAVQSAPVLTPSNRNRDFALAVCPHTLVVNKYHDALTELPTDSKHPNEREYLELVRKFSSNALINKSPHDSNVLKTLPSAATTTCGDVMHDPAQRARLRRSTSMSALITPTARYGYLPSRSVETLATPVPSAWHLNDCVSRNKEVAGEGLRELSEISVFAVRVCELMGNYLSNDTTIDIIPKVPRIIRYFEKLVEKALLFGVTMLRGDSLSRSKFEGIGPERIIPAFENFLGRLMEVTYKLEGLAKSTKANKYQREMMKVLFRMEEASVKCTYSMEHLIPPKFAGLERWDQMQYFRTRVSKMVDLWVERGEFTASDTLFHKKEVKAMKVQLKERKEKREVEATKKAQRTKEAEEAAARYNFF